MIKFALYKYKEMGRTPVDKPRINNYTKQKEISDSLFNHFMTDGFLSISTDKMCEITKKSKATLYKYFESKQEIVTFIFNERVQDLILFNEFIIDENYDHITRYQKAVSSTAKALDGISSIFLREVGATYPELFNVIIELKKVSIELLKDFYNDGIKKNVFVDINADVLVIHDDLFFTALLNTDYLELQKIDIKTLFEGYFKIRFNGILKK